MTEIDVLKNCRVEGNNIYLPEGQLDRKLYQKVAKRLNLIGGKWIGRKIQAFVFDSDPTELLAQIASGEARNIKKEYQFFATPDDLADIMVEHADLEYSDQILEPSAGQGAIVKAINQNHWFVHPDRVECYEIMNINRTKLRNSGIEHKMLGNDFLQAPDEPLYDKIIANPPFSKNQDIDHIYKMYSLLKDGGRIVTLSGTHWTFASENKCVQFREWINEIGAEVCELPKDVFKASGTNIETLLIIINR